MVKVYWGSSFELSPESKYLAMTVDLERKSYLSFFSFLRKAQSMLPELKNAKGIVGYEGVAGVFSKKAKFLSVWESESQLYEFVHCASHANAMVKFKPATKDFKLTKWNILGSEVPKDWKDALSNIPMSGVIEK